MTEPAKALFLSDASQDAEAAFPEEFRGAVASGDRMIMRSPVRRSKSMLGTIMWTVSALSLIAACVAGCGGAEISTPPISSPTSSQPGALNLQWAQSVTPEVTGNNIYRRLMNGGTYSSSPTSSISANTSYLDSNLSLGTPYCYVVTAISAGGESAFSNEACATAK
jgi:hypothetical protein